MIGSSLHRLALLTRCELAERLPVFSLSHAMPCLGQTILLTYLRCHRYCSQVIEQGDVVVQVDSVALSRHMSALGIQTGLSLLMRLVSYETVPQKPPGPWDAVTPAPKLISPLASVTLKNHTPSIENADEAVSGAVQERPPTGSMNVVGVSSVNSGDGMIITLPRLKGSESRDTCSADTHCKGVSTRTVKQIQSSTKFEGAYYSNRRRQLAGGRHKEEEVFPFAGRCVAGACTCPLPFVGDRCEDLFECLWWNPGIEDWVSNGCSLDSARTTQGSFVCNCSLVGSADVQVVVRQIISDAFAIQFNTFSFDDAKYFADLGDNIMPLVVLGSLNAVFLLGALSAVIRSNERRLRKYDRHYTFWRQQHNMRVAKVKPSFKKRTWTQFKGQHKLLRVFYQQFELGQDPIAQHTGAQKLAVLYVIILMKMTVSSMLSQLTGTGGSVKQSTAVEQVVTKIMIGLVSAAFSLPASVVLDQLFWKQQRMTNKKQKHDADTTEVQLIARAAIHATFNAASEQWVIMMWKLAVEELRVAEIREKLFSMRVGRLTMMQDKAAREKMYQELGKAVEQFQRVRVEIVRGTNVDLGLRVSKANTVSAVHAGVGLSAGLQVGDVIASVNGQTVGTGSGAAIQLLQERPKEGKLVLEVLKVSHAGSKFMALVSAAKRKAAATKGRDIAAEIIEQATLRIQRSFRARRADNAVHTRMFNAKRIAQVWRNKRSTKVLDAIIETEVLRIQQAVRWHSHQRVECAVQHAKKLGQDRPIGRARISPSACGAPAMPIQSSSMVVPSRAHSDVHLWFEPASWLMEDQHVDRGLVPTPPASPPEAGASSSQPGSRSASSSRQRSVPTCLPGALAPTNSSRAVVPLEAACNGRERPSAGNRYCVLSRGGFSSGSSSRSIAASDFTFGSESSRAVTPAAREATPQPIKSASPFRVQRRLVLDGPQGGRLLAARAQVLATRVAAHHKVRRSKLVAIDQSKVQRTAKKKHVPLVYETFENVRAIEVLFGQWRDFAIGVSVVSCSIQEDSGSQEAAAVRLQSVARGYAARKATRAANEVRNASSALASETVAVSTLPSRTPSRTIGEHREHLSPTQASFLADSAFAQFFVFSNEELEVEAQEAKAISEFHQRPLNSNQSHHRSSSRQRYIDTPLRAVEDFSEITPAHDSPGVADESERSNSSDGDEGERAPLTPNERRRTSTVLRNGTGDKLTRGRSDTAKKKGLMGDVGSTDSKRLAKIHPEGTGGSGSDGATSTLVKEKILIKIGRKVVPGPIRTCYSGMCKSVFFWRSFPWAFTLVLVVICHFQTLFVTMRIFAQYPNAIEVGFTWLQAIGISLATGWFVQDPVIIIVRNNLSCTKTIIRSKKYQFIEKFVVQPWRLAASYSLAMAQRLLD